MDRIFCLARAAFPTKHLYKTAQNWAYLTNGSADGPPDHVRDGLLPLLQVGTGHKLEGLEHALVDRFGKMPEFQKDIQQLITMVVIWAYQISYWCLICLYLVAISLRMEVLRSVA